ncbi:putative metal-dependent phosphoesterase TrpH [Lachnospiraceae bacterium PF1-21]|uniref:PHP domain-containing protein n=1 Tax=Ohessyouella blattaphilus TaxID=2949333 RepID=A0ABT1EDH6_9FIRM|nr:PHP-associated domain-containing protein [Ohessyouella blattaphilus]MCP1108750.1 PHP domain-containing protein [Ohessyouella blattaphilus]MCR8562144.1 PHP domain-containing protein [Ohessyouella blattaphilus]
MKLDMHCHVKEGSIDSKVGLDEYITKLKAAGFQGMLITDHDTYNGYRYWKSSMKGKAHQDFVVLKGIEYDTCDAGHIICILPEGVRMRLMEIKGLPVSVLINFVHRHGGILGPAHPCGEKYMSFTNTKKYRRHPEITQKFDFIETFNACESAKSNAAALELAKTYNKPGFGGSDAHKLECVSMAHTTLARPVKSETELISLVKKGEVLAASGDYYTATTKEKIGKINNVLVYSFWFYNKLGALIKRHKRKLKGAVENPVDPIDPLDVGYLHEIKRYKAEA